LGEFRLARGFNAPRPGSASLEGSTPPLGRGPPRSRVQRPLGEDRLARGYLHARLPTLLPPCTSISCPDTAGRTPRLWHARESRPGAVPPTPWGRPSPPLCSTVRQGRCQLRDTVPPTPIRLTHRALEGGPTAPSNVFPLLTQGHAVTSGRRDRSFPSLSTLCDHLRHCRTAPGTVTTSRRCWGTRGQDVTTTATVPRTGPPSTAPSNRPTTAASQPTATPPPSKSLLYEHRTHHDASTRVGFARTAVSSMALLAIPPHVGK
jgi:hypothetical protein